MKTKKKISLVTGPLAGYGGEETAIINFVNHLSDKYELNVYIPQMVNGTNWLNKINSNVSIMYNPKKLNGLQKIFFMWRYLIRNDCDILVAFTPKIVLFTYLFRVILFKRFKIVSWVQFSISDYFSNRVQKLLKYSDKHLAISTGIKQQLIGLGIAPEDIFVVYNAVKKSNITISPNQDTAHFIYIARIQFEQEKNMRALFDACARLKGKWVLDIYGNDDSVDHIELKKCHAYIDELGIKNNIIWHGWVKDVWNSIDNASCLLLSSRSEGFGMVLAEAISNGIPVVSFNCPVGPADIVNENNGFLIENGNIIQFSEKAQGFIDDKYKFNAKDIKMSISDMYEDEYYKRMECILDSIGEV